MTTWQLLLAATDKSRIIMFATNSGHQLRNFYGAVNDMQATPFQCLLLRVSHLWQQIHPMQSGLVTQQLLCVLHKPGSQCLCLGGCNTTFGTSSQGSYKNVERFRRHFFDRQSCNRQFWSQRARLEQSLVMPIRHNVCFVVDHGIKDSGLQVESNKS